MHQLELLISSVTFKQNCNSEKTLWEYLLWSKSTFDGYLDHLKEPRDSTNSLNNAKAVSHTNIVHGPKIQVLCWEMEVFDQDCSVIGL